MSPVFGFNTDIRYADTVYHVQTEAHEAELTVQTAIFVRGRCIEKQQTSYANQAATSGFSEGTIHQILTQQHKMFVNCIREGKLELLGTLTKTSVPPAPRDVDFGQAPATAVAPAIPVPSSPPSLGNGPSDASNDDILELSTSGLQPLPVVPPLISPQRPASSPVAELKLDWLSSDSAFKGDSVFLKYRLTSGSRGIEGAKLVARLEISGVPSAYARSVTDCQGEAEVTLKVSAAAMSSNAISITVQATHAGQSTARRFRLSKS